MLARPPSSLFPSAALLVGTPKGRLSKLEAQLTSLPWETVRDGIEVKLPLGHELGAEWLPQEGELYVFAQSRDRINKERAMPPGPELAEGRRRALRKLLTRLGQLRAMELQRDQLLMKIGEAKAAAGRAYHLVDIRRPAAREAISAQTFTFKLNRAKLRIARRREGRYPVRLRSGRSALAQQPMGPAARETLGVIHSTDWLAHPPSSLFPSASSQVEEAFKNIKGDPFGPFGCAQGARWPSDPSTISAKTASRHIC